MDKPIGQVISCQAYGTCIIVQMQGMIKIGKYESTLADKKHQNKNHSLQRKPVSLLNVSHMSSATRFFHTRLHHPGIFLFR
ncbi:MAG: hypothetical protein PVH04_11675, partial [Gammaproteobacteria bacterium]